MTNKKFINEINECLEEPTSKEKLESKLNMENGQKFTYKGIEFIKLDDVDGGMLCITSKICEYLPFDHNWKKDVYNNFKESDIKRILNTYFLDKLNKDDLISFDIDLGRYGKDTVLVGLLTKDQYEKYQNLIPKMDWDWWLASSPDRSDTYIAYSVRTDGSLSVSIASGSGGAVPACVFKSSILESPSLDGTTKMEDN